jgi:hypothetical protein
MGYKIIGDKIDKGRLVGKEYYDYKGGRFRWRIKDADGVVYYYILSDADPYEGDEDEIFKPLDWARAVAGCTTLEFKDALDGKYREI